ncbi:hypothetical protein AB1Y20_022229 [Prymnesium parvum]|uniref:Uncharacterized protein n=1 Tax=Prymnesium parvum TaxID=97485 RepID=A0AB34JIR5_PRYPA
MAPDQPEWIPSMYSNVGGRRLGVGELHLDTLLRRAWIRLLPQGWAASRMPTSRQWLSCLMGLPDSSSDACPPITAAWASIAACSASASAASVATPSTNRLREGGTEAGSPRPI